MTRKTWMTLALSALVSAHLMAGVVYEIEVTDHEQSPPKTSEMEIAAEGRHLKMGIAPGESGRAGGDAIWRGDRREMVVVDHEDRSYVVIDEEMIESLAGRIGGVLSQVEEALKNVPDDQRAMVERMMKQRMPQQAPKLPVTAVNRTSELADRNGYPCVKYEVLIDGRLIRRLWVTDWDNIEGGDDVADVFREMAGFFRQLMESIGQAAGGLFQGDAGAGFIAELGEIDGFPVVTEELGDDGSLEKESGLRSARRRTLDPAAFEPPSGYKRRSMLGQ